MALGQQRRAVGAFSNYRDAEIALRELQSAGFPMQKVSVIGPNAGEVDRVADIEVTKPANERAGGGAKAGATAGAVTGGLIGLIGGLSALTIPGIGPVVAGGALASILGDALVGGAIGAAAGGIVGALVGLGVPENRARGYSDRLSRGQYLVIVEGTDEELNRAESILRVRGIEDWGIYDLPSGRSERASDRQKRAVGVFATRHETEQALTELRNAGFQMDNASVIARDADRQDDIAGVDVKDNVGNQADLGATKGALSGGTAGGLTGLLVGLGLVAIPGLGPIMLAGAGATALATTLAGTAIGAAAGGLIGALVGLGIPEEQARTYSDRIARGEYVVLLKGTEAELDRAQSILRSRGIQDWGIYDYPSVDTARAEYGVPGSPSTDTTPDLYGRDRDIASRR
ncbi:MAG: general stress protein [Actinomycetota bacterium]